jgi:putative tryptophan/tyrosine transport system substrate-binding protein
LGGKWLELLKEVALHVTRVAVLRDPSISAEIGQFAVVQSLAPSAGVDVQTINVRDANEIVRAVTSFVCTPNGG